MSSFYLDVQTGMREYLSAFQDREKHQKKLMKSKNLLEYEAAVNGLFRECEVDSSIGFRAG